LSKCGGMDLPISTRESSESAIVIHTEQNVTSFHYQCFTSKCWFDISSHLLGAYVIFWHASYAILKWTKTTLWLKVWKVTRLWHLGVEACIEIVPYTYTYACGKNNFIGQSYWLSCCGVWHSSGLKILPVLVKVLGEFVFDKNIIKPKCHILLNGDKFLPEP
jgi:hypothetical protein